MTKDPQSRLSRRERQIMELIYRVGAATAQEVREGLEDAPGYSAVRAHLRILEEKGHLEHRQDGLRYVYLPTVPAQQARRSALSAVLRNFFHGSREELIASLLQESDGRLSETELKNIRRMIDQARKEGR